MNRKEQIEYLKRLPIKERAKKHEKAASCVISCVLVLAALILGIYDSFVSPIIFDESFGIPLLKIIILLAIAIAIAWPIYYFYERYWHEYNKLVQEARKNVYKQEEILREHNQNILEKEYIEKHMEEISYKQFAWHSARYCWGCGEEHKHMPRSYNYVKERTHTWKSGMVRKTKT